MEALSPVRMGLRVPCLLGPSRTPEDSAFSQFRGASTPSQSTASLQPRAVPLWEQGGGSGG